MKTKITLLTSAWLLIACSVASAQHLVPGATNYYEMAFLFSQQDYKGSSRIQGLGGAQISLGGDLSSALSNPAGLGFYNRSEFSFTPSLNFFNTESLYQNRVTEVSNPRFNFDQFGVALNKRFKENNAGFISGTFAISYSKVSEYHQDYEFSGFNTLNDIIDYYVTEANRQNVDPDELGGLAGKAYDAYLISEFYDVYEDGTEVPFYARTFFGEIPESDSPTEQLEVVDTYGSQNLFSFAYGANLKDKVYFGANLNLASINYEIVKQYEEFYPSGRIVSSSFIREDLRTEGTGVGLSFGTIVRPAPFMTLGASIATPTWYSMTEEYFSSFRAAYSNFSMSNYDDYFADNESLIIPDDPADDYVETYTTYNSNVTLNNVSIDDEPNVFEYNFSTPMRVNGGATFFISKYGFITADVEWIDYSRMKLGSDGDSMNDQEQIIRANYRDVVNFKIGAEARLDNFRIRGGYNLQSNPYTSASNQNGQVNRFSAGVGYRNSKMFVDVATTYLKGSAKYSPYTFAPEDEGGVFVTPVATIDYSDVNVNFTLGFFF